MTNNEACLAALRSVEFSSARHPAMSICVLAEDYIESVLHLDSSILMLSISDAMKMWPKNSGNENFPVPSVCGDSPLFDFHNAQVNVCMWEGAYGELRKELLAFLINHFDARVGMNK